MGYEEPAPSAAETSASMTIAELSLFQPSLLARLWSWLRYGAAMAPGSLT